jgi:hypothetical protein
MGRLVSWRTSIFGTQDCQFAGSTPCAIVAAAPSRAARRVFDIGEDFLSEHDPEKWKPVFR